MKRAGHTRGRIVRMREGLSDRTIFSVGILAGIAAAVLSLFSAAPGRVVEKVTGIGAPPGPSLESRAFTAMREGDIDEAVKLFTRASKKEPKDAMKAYNLACALSRAGEPDNAIGALRRAVDAGFSDSELMRHDTGLSAVRESAPAFQVLLAEVVTNDPSHQLDFLVGMWELRDQNGIVFAQSEIIRLHRGMLYLEAWRQGTFESTTMLSFDPGLKTWERRQMTDDGPRWRYEGTVDESGALNLSGGPPEEPNRRMRFTPVPGGSVERLRERRNEDGTWRTDDISTYVRTEGSVWDSRLPK